jgi:hypothetical protein
LEGLFGNRLARAFVDCGFTWYARRRANALDKLSIADAQQRCLLRLVRFARDTRFGREHDFRGIRSIADYQKRVPLRGYEAFWADYWQCAYPDLANVTWPGRIPYLALSSGTTSGATKRVPVSRQMLASNQEAALTSLAWFRAAFPNTPLFNGRLFFLGGSTDLRSSGAAIQSPLAGDLSGIAAREAPVLMGPYTFPPKELALLSDWEEKLTRLAERSTRLPITMISGVPSWLLVLFDRLKQITGKSYISDIWPMLRLVIHGGTSFEPYCPLFRKVIGNEEVRFLETYPASEGFIAAQDPRFDLLRLIPDHNIFFEFVPVAELGSSRPTRHTAASVVPGIQYAVVLTTCAGLWSYVIGDTVCFESTNPPLLRFTGRTKYFLSAFGEHLICEEVERAIARAAESTGSSVTDFHVGPVFPTDVTLPGRHRYLVEFVQAPGDLNALARALDAALCKANEDYAAHRVGGITMLEPEVLSVRRGGIGRWMKANGKLGGQHKLPRMDNSGKLTEEMYDWLVTDGSLEHRSDQRSIASPANHEFAGSA